MKRLYPKYALNDVVEHSLTKSEIMQKVKTYYKSPLGLFRLSCVVATPAFFGLMLGSMMTWQIAGLLLFFALMLGYLQYDSLVDYYTRLPVYDDIEAHRKELEDFLKERGYYDPK